MLTFAYLGILSCYLKCAALNRMIQIAKPDSYIANKAPDKPILAWSVTCATGEETYSLAMLLIEALGVNQFQQQVEIYGTNVDPDAVQIGRQNL